jgi:hypothetical protein
VGIGTTSPDPTAALEIESTTQGILIPRMTKDQREMIVDPVQGLLTYQIDFSDGFYFYNGTIWLSLNDNESLIQDDDGDTRIEVEKMPDEDIIRLTVANNNIVTVENSNGLTSSIDGGPAITGISTNNFGTGVLGRGDLEGLGTNYGGKFYAKSFNGYGVFGEASSTSSQENFGGYFTAAGGFGKGVYGEAKSTGPTNYGGYFIAQGSLGRGVYGEANSTSSATNYGGYFVAKSTSGYGVYGNATGTSGKGVYGFASSVNNSSNYGGYFVASGTSGQGVYGEASSFSGSLNYGGHFVSNGTSGIGVYGNAFLGTGVYGRSSGSSGRGVYGESFGTTGRGVSGYTSGGSGYGVYGQADAQGAFAVYGTSSSGYAGYFNGDLCYTGSFGACSDLRFKNNINKIPNALDGILKLRGVTHTWKSSEFQEFNWPDKPSYGVIAQEIEPIFPYLIDEKDGYKYVDYAKFVPILIEAIKQQQKEISELKNILMDLQN